MKLKLLTLAGLCMMMVALWAQPVRAHCDAGNIHMHGYYYYDIYNSGYWSGCIYEGTVTEGPECINWFYNWEHGYFYCSAYNHWVNCDGCW